MGIACALLPGVAHAQSATSEVPRPAEEERTYTLQPPSPLYSDPFAGMLWGFQAPSGVGLGLVFAPLDETLTYAPDDEYASPTSYHVSTDAFEGERAASLVAYPVGRGVLVTGMFRYVQLNSALDIAMGRAAPWTSVAPRGGGIGLVGAF